MRKIPYHAVYGALIQFSFLAYFICQYFQLASGKIAVQKLVDDAIFSSQCVKENAKTKKKAHKMR